MKRMAFAALLGLALMSCGEEDVNQTNCLESFGRFSDRLDPGVSCTFESGGQTGCQLDAAVSIESVSGTIGAGCYRENNCSFACD